MIRCSLTGCGFDAPNGTGAAAHARAHVMRGEANFGPDKQLIATGVPIAKSSYERKQRMDAIGRGEIQSSLKFGQSDKKNPKVSKTALAVKAPVPVLASDMPIDVSSLNPEQLSLLREQLGVQEVELQHSCTTTRAVDRMKDAIVMTTVAEMLDSVPADQMLVMLTQMKRMPMMPVRR